MEPPFDRLRSRPRAGSIGIIVALVAVLAMAIVTSLVSGRPGASSDPLGPGSSTAVSAPPSPTLSPTPVASPIALVPWDQLDRRWGTYVPEREWGTPREAVGGDGWGLGYTNATSVPYRYGEDGIAGVSDEEGDVVVSWAFWDEQRSLVTERYFGASNPQGEHGETIAEDRVFKEHSPTHSYARQVFRYGADNERMFSIELEMAKVDSRSLLLRATATGEAGATGPLHLVVRVRNVHGERDLDSAIRPMDRGLIVEADSHVAIVGKEPFRSWQASEDKAALDENLRAGGLTGSGRGRYGALDSRLKLMPGASGSITVAIGESPPEGDAQDAGAAALAAVEMADAVFEQRRAEAQGIFAARVSDHQELYQAALSALIWNESLYRWDGESSAIPRWTGIVNAGDVLIMPDKWEYPYVAAWDSAFQAVTATLVDPGIAQAQLRFLLSERWQQPDGHVPCAEWVMETECPPVLAWAAWRVYQASDRDRVFLGSVYRGLQRQYRYWWNELGVGGGLFTGGFLGMDNLPRSKGTAQADASGWMAFFARDLARIAGELGDPAAQGAYEGDIELIRRGVNDRLWNEATGWYHDLDETERGFIALESYSGLIPLIAGIVPEERKVRMLEALRDEQRFLGPAGVRSVPASSGAYLPGYAGRGVNSNWLGPVWMPISYLLIHALEEVDPALAEEIRDRTVAAVERDWKSTGRFHEYFHGDTGEGLGADEQGWTLLVANLIAEGWPKATR